MSSKSKFKPQTKFFDLSFEDYPGLEVRTRSATIGEIHQAQEMSVNSKDAESQKQTFAFFEKKLVEWNVIHPEVEGGGECPLCGLNEDDDVPTTVDGMLCLDIAIMTAIIFGWIQTVARVSIPKGMSMPDGVSNGPDSNLSPTSERIMQEIGMLQSPGISLTPNLSLD